MTRLRALTLLAFLFSIAFAKAQTFSVKGILKDKLSQEPLEAATVFVETTKDTTLVTYTITNSKGVFELEGRTAEKEVALNISFIGYKSYRKVFDISQGPVNVGDVLLDFATATLDEVVVKSRSPITVKKDTLEFNVKSFKTKKDANIEDLLKELPGVEVDEEGKIRVNGKEVNKILVNGKPFFGDDPTIATRNLTKEIVEKIQIVDTKTDDEAFSGEAGDSENKTINLTIAEENNKGVFGRVNAGGGTDDRFEYAGIVNVFDNERRISVLAGGNNINSPGFSFGEIQKMFGNGGSSFISSNGSFGIGGRSFGGGSGIVNSRNAGANYADEITEKFDVSTDYFYSGANSNNETRTERESILPDSRFFTNSNSRDNINSDNHDINANFNIKVDSTFLINIRPSFGLSRNRAAFGNDEQSFNENGEQVNTSQLSTREESTGRNFENNLSLTKRFGDKGAFVKVRFANELEREESEEFLVSQVEIFGENSSLDERNQLTDGETSLDGINGGVTYRLPLISKKLFLDAELQYRNDRRDRRRSTFDFDNTTQTYTVFNELLSTDFSSRNIRTTPELSLSYNDEKLRLSLGAGYVLRTIANEDMLRPELNIEQDFQAIELSSYFNYRFSPKMSTYMGYNLNNAPPNVSQLNPFLDVSDPLNTVQGNPDLAPSNTHRLYAGFNNYDFQKGGGYYANLNGNITNDAVTSRTIVDENLVRSTTFVNVDGNYSVNASAGYDKSIKLDSIRTFKYGVGLYGNFNRNVNFNNGVQYASKTRSLTPNANLSFSWKGLFEIRPRYNVSFSTTQFGIDAFEDQEFLNHNLRINTSFFAIKHVEWRNDMLYNYNPNVADGFQKSSWFWNTTVAYSFLKDNATLTFKIYDVLNQNTNARRTANANFIQDVQSTVLEQYFMLSFSWKFNTLGQGGETGNDSFWFF